MVSWGRANEDASATCRGACGTADEVQDAMQISAGQGCACSGTYAAKSSGIVSSPSGVASGGLPKVIPRTGGASVDGRRGHDGRRGGTIAPPSNWRSHGLVRHADR